MTRRLEISDHALLRYMQQGMGLDVEQLRRQLATRVDAASAGRDGMCGVNVDGVHLVVRGHVVTTAFNRCAHRRGSGRG
ncbi:hypothetical protein J4E08_09980 [Sagittula sp. NFXS13]|uniref:hypothetical protein n=1 Tax=Sagittula sp. NFXS13 TaxID=2819095 RepID=UPI0032DE8CD6